MLDVHPIHGAAHSWKDFFIHIATISVGLLIALGLEQTAEYAHHRHQLTEARRDLVAELGENRHQLEMNIEETQKIAADLDADIAFLRANQSSHSPIGGRLIYQTKFYWPSDGTWQAVKQTGSLGLMPRDELQRYVYFYEVVAAVMDAITVLVPQMEVASAIAQRAPDSNLTPRDVDELITVTSEAKGRAASLLKVLHFEERGLQNAQR